MKKIIALLLGIIIGFMLGSTEEPVSAMTATYTSLGVPTNVDTSFKTYMDHRAVTNTSSAQYKYIKRWGWCDEQGFMRATGERELGITDDYYLIALGSYYGTTVGTKYRITTDTGNMFYGVLADLKDDRHTNSTNQYASNKDVVEFIVDTRYLNKTVRKMGSANAYKPLYGRISKIERIDFIESTGGTDMCEFCNGDDFIIYTRTRMSDKADFIPGIDVHLDGRKLSVCAVADTYEPNFMEACVLIRYCPMCGEKLKDKD